MPWQLIFTSVPRGLASGQSGFCTVARSADLREALTPRLEQLSSYHYLQLPGAGSATRNPTIAAYRIVDVRGAKYHVLTRIQPSGLDFTARTNHLAQHLVFRPEELPRLPAPSAILLHWKGWLTAWQGQPQFLDQVSADDFAHVPGPAWPARGWLQATGDAGRAAGLLENEYIRGCYLLTAAGGEQTLLELFRETLQLSNYNGKSPLRPWQYTFTNFLQAEDTPADFQWRGCQENTPAWEQAMRRSAPLVPLETVRIPNNPLVRIAREGLKPPSPAPRPMRPGAPLKIQRQPSPWKPAPRTGLPPQASTPSRRRSSNSGDWEIQISLSGLLKGLAAAAVLVLLAWGVNNRYLHVWHSRQPGSAGVASGASNALPAQPLSPPQLPMIAGSTRQKLEAPEPPPEARIEAPQLEEELKNAFVDRPEYRDVLTYVIVVSALDTNVVPASDMPLLGRVLEGLRTLNLYTRNLELRYDQNNWYLRITPRMTVSNSADFDLLGDATNAEPPGVFKPFRVSFTRLNPSVEVQVLPPLSPPLQALSVFCGPVGGANFQSFRLLILNESAPPKPLELSMDFLSHSNSDYPTVFKEPLRRRLTPFKLLASVSWQLCPCVWGKNGHLVDVLADWPGEQGSKPQLGPHIALAELRGALEEELSKLTNQVAELDQKLASAPQKDSSNLDLSVPLGSWLRLTNEELRSFEQFSRAQRASNQLSSSYLAYLGKVTKQADEGARLVRRWSAPTGSKDESIALGLEVLRNSCLSNFPDLATKLTIEGPTTNYFVAVWKALKSQDAEGELRQRKADINDHIAALAARLQLIPSRIDQLAGLKLCLVNQGGKPLEMIRFTARSAGK